MSTGIKTLGAISSVEQKGLVSLYLGELMAKAFDLDKGGVVKRSWIRQGGNLSNLTTSRTSDGVTIGGNIAILDKTLDFRTRFH